MWAWLKSQWSHAREGVREWYEDTRWYHLVMGAGISIGILTLGDLVPLLIAPVFLTGIPQFDFLLGIGSWVGTIWLWSFFREGAMFLLCLTSVRVAKVICKTASKIMGWHHSNGYWWTLPVTFLALLVWDLMGDNINKALSRMIIAKGEETLEDLKTTGDSPYLGQRVLNKLRTVFEREGNDPKPRTTIKAVEIGRNALIPVDDLEPVTCEGGVDRHVTPVKKSINMTFEDAKKISAFQREHGRLPKAGEVVPYQVEMHDDIRLRYKGKVYSLVDKKPGEEVFGRKQFQWINSSEKHGSKLLTNEGDPLPGGAVYLAGEYGNGYSRPISTEPVIVWKSREGNLHFVLGGNKVYAINATNKGYLLTRKVPKEPRYSGRPFNPKVCTDPEAAINDRQVVWTEKYSGAMAECVTSSKGLHVTSKGLAGDGTELVYDQKIRGVTSAKIPKKWQNCYFVAEVCLGKGPVTNESKVAGMLNAHLPLSLKRQAEEGHLILKVIALVEKDGKDLRHLPWRENRKLVARMNRDINRFNGKHVLHKIEVYPKSPKVRRKLYAESQRQGREGYMLWNPNLGLTDPNAAAKLKHVERREGVIVAVQRHKGTSAKWAGKEAAGSFTVRIQGPTREVNTKAQANYFPGTGLDVPVGNSDVFKLVAWANQNMLIGKTVRIRVFRAANGSFKACVIEEMKP